MRKFGTVMLLGLVAAPALAQTAPAAPPLSRATFLATMDAEYRRIDTNNDGGATRAEVAANQQRIVAASAQARIAAAFASIDKDRNGQISPAEFTAANGGGKLPAVDPTGVMSRLDGNRDGKVTLVEYRTLTLANFDRLDTDKDGILSPAEQRAGGFAR